jgi:hypothetical protein
MSYIFRSSSPDKFIVDVFIVNLLVEMNCSLQSQSLTCCALPLMDWELDCWALDMSSAQYQGRQLWRTTWEDVQQNGPKVVHVLHLLDFTCWCWHNKQLEQRKVRDA